MADHASKNLRDELVHAPVGPAPYPVSGPEYWPVVDEARMREIDRIMIEDLRIDLMQMMENAGRSLAHVALHRFVPRSVVVFAGAGGNGGGGLAAARHLNNHGVSVHVHLTKPSISLSPAAARQCEILRLSGVIVDEPMAPLQTGDLIIDAMIGYSLRGNPTGEVASVIAWMSATSAPVLSLDVPAGFSAASGKLSAPHVSANATLTLATLKTDLIDCQATGDLLVADIGVPGHIFDRWGATRPPFGKEWIVEIALTPRGLSKGNG